MDAIPSGLTQIPVFLFLILAIFSHPIAAVQELLTGFTATPDSSVSLFQPLLTDSVGNYSLGFLRVDRSQLSLAVIHVPSKEQLWVAGKSPLAQWSSQIRLLFNGSLVMFDMHTGVALWSSYTDAHRVRLSNTSNLLIEAAGDGDVLWQSFDFPFDTLMENQNFTSDMTLVSSNGLYSMKLGSNFIGYYARFKPGSDPGLLYFQHTPMEAKARVIKGQGQIRVILSPDGFLGMYQNTTTPSVDMQPFSTFQQPGTGNRRVRLESDGNLIGYYWTGSSWVVDFKQISNQCDLPSPCGPYGLCNPDKGCSCVDHRKEYTSGADCETSGDDFCRENHRILRRTGLEVPNKEIMQYTIMGSLEKCEGACEENCSCWGALYSNTSGFCYTINYPIQTLVEVLDETKVGYFKVTDGAGKDNAITRVWVGIGVLCGLVLLTLGVGGAVLYKKESRGVNGYIEEVGRNDAVGGPYKNLRSASFNSIELCER